LLRPILLLTLACATLLYATGCPQKDPGDPQAPEIEGNAAPAGQPGGPAAEPRVVVQNPPGLVTSDFKVEGMTCADCSKSIEATLIRVPGVSTVSADDKAGTTRVQYDPGDVTPAALIEAMDKLKFKATLVSTSEPGKPREGEAKS
jgi:copper chaperone CopZ